VVTVRAQAAEGLEPLRADHRTAADELQRLDDARAHALDTSLEEEEDLEEDEEDKGGTLRTLDRPAVFRGLGGGQLGRDGSDDLIELVLRNSSSSSAAGAGDSASFGGSPPRYARRIDATSPMSPDLSPGENSTML
jgi:hypothetical protein